MKTLMFVLIASVLTPLFTAAQVDDIKKESSKTQKSEKKKSKSTSSGTSISGDGIVAALELTFYGVIFIAGWQQHTLEKRNEIPSIISFDVMAQVASQPGNYYVVNPRVRANWGLFSTDFRFNYLIEESIEGAKYIRTDDWQILELNIVTTKNFTGRIGGGVMRESFSGGKSFNEWTTALSFMSNNEKIGAMTEFRWAEPRTEVSAQMQFRLFPARSVHTYATAGVVYQQYYDRINVWGVQVGLMVKLFKGK